MTSARRFDVSCSTRASRIGLAGACACCVFFASFPFWAEPAWMHEFDEMACYLILALTWNLLAGYGGMVSIGQQAYFGLGGYALVVLSNSFAFNPFVAVPLAVCVTLSCAVPVSKLALRLQGGHFAVGTWVIAEVFKLSFANLSAVGGGSGNSHTALRGIPAATRFSVTFWLCLAAVVATVALVYGWLRSRQGLALLAIRDNEVAAESQGINVRATKRAVYLISATGAGLAGALYFLGNSRISPEAAFTVNWTAFSIFVVLIGGIGTIEGPVIGVALFYLVSKLFSDYGTWYLVGLGSLAIAITILFPRGLWGYFSRAHDVHFFPIQRRLVQPLLPPQTHTSRGSEAQPR